MRQAKPKKTITKQKGPATQAIGMPVSQDTSREVRVEKIKNGYLVHHTTMDEKGYKTEKVFHPKKPKINVSVEPPK